MLNRFSSVSRSTPSRSKAASSARNGDGDPSTTRTSSIWSAVRGKRSGTQNSAFSFLSSTFRRQSTKTGGPDPWTRKNRLMHPHKVKTKNGTIVEVFFGSESMSIDGTPFKYAEMVLWSHSPSCFKLTTMQSNEQIEIILYPCEDGPSTTELNEMIGMRVAQLVTEQTGCSEEEARILATKEATDAEMRIAGEVIDTWGKT
jgi:hypothetical protein